MALVIKKKPVAQEVPVVTASEALFKGSPSVAGTVNQTQEQEAIDPIREALACISHLDRQIEKHDQAAKAAAAAKKSLQLERADHTAVILKFFKDQLTEDDEGLEEHKFGYGIDISAKTRKREISNPEKLREILGEANFLALASIALGDIDKYTTEAQREEFLETTYVEDSRKVTVTPPASKGKK